jgi:DNA mismatch repair protein MutH
VKPAPRSESELLARAAALAGRTVGELAGMLGTGVPPDLRRHKGWTGVLLERALGASAGSRPEPDFVSLGVELKTLPLGANGRPCESTHVCAINLAELNGITWPRSLVRRKLARVLWIPIAAPAGLPAAARRIGAPILWSPSASEEQVLREDWEELVELMATGRLHELDARLGRYLQVRPKAAHGRALTAAHDVDGARGATLPRGFYLRASFTAGILAGAP